jgi:DNA ligase-1
MAANRDIFAMLSKKRQPEKPLSPPKGDANTTETPERPKASTEEPSSLSPKRRKVEMTKGSEEQEAIPVETKEQDDSPDSLAFDSDTEKKDYEDAKQILSLSSSSSRQPSNIKEGKPIPYSAVVEVFEQIEATSKRLEIIQLTSDFFLKVLDTNPTDLIPITYLFINRLGPDYEGLELGLGETILIKTIAESTGKSTQQIKLKYKETGDLGTIALQARNVQPTMFKPKALTVNVVFQNLKEIAMASGNKSQEKKINIIKRMLTASQGLEAKFLIRSLESKLRIGLAEKTVLISLAKALLIHEKGNKISAEQFVRAEEQIRDAFCQIPNYEIVISTALEYSVLELDKHCVLRPGIPLKPMLAKPTKSITEILDRFTGEQFTCEYKYDGERAQVHLQSDGKVKIYSRNSEDMSQRYPDIVDAVKGFLNKDDPPRSLILDCEAVAWSREEQKILPFQVLSTRKRKDVNADDIKVQVCLFAFDLLCYNDQPMINEPLRKRRELLFKYTVPIPGKFQYATSKTTSDVEELQAFLDESVKNSCEGLMVKTLDSDPYRPSQRSNSWLKLKKDYLAGVGDSLDLVVIGAYYGKGKRTGTYGGFLLASYNQDSGDYETCCKIGTGFSDEMLKQLYEKLSKTESEEPMSYYVYDSSALPDIWFQPTTLFEVLTADLSLSPIYKAGQEIYGRGVSLRFPRFIRIREDKRIEDATSSDQVVEFYERQSGINQ